MGTSIKGQTLHEGWVSEPQICRRSEGIGSGRMTCASKELCSIYEYECEDAELGAMFSGSDLNKRPRRSSTPSPLSKTHKTPGTDTCITEQREQRNRVLFKQGRMYIETHTIDKKRKVLGHGDRFYDFVCSSVPTNLAYGHGLGNHEAGID